MKNQHTQHIRRIISLIFLFSFFSFSTTTKAFSPKLDSLKQVFSNTENSLDRSKILRQISNAWRKENQDSSLHYVQLAFSESEKINAYDEMAKNKISIAILYGNKRDYESSLKYFAELEQLLPQLTEKGLASNIRYLHGRQLMKGRKFEEAISYGKENLEVILANKDTLYAGKLLNVMGNVYLYQSIYEPALDYYLLAVDYFEISKNENDLAGINMNLGNIYVGLYEEKKAVPYFQKALMHFEKVGDEFRILQCNINIGRAYLFIEELEEALVYLQKSKQMAEANDPNHRLASIYSFLGELHTQTKENELAERYLLKAIPLAENRQRYDVLTDSYLRLGALNYFQKKYKLAEKYCLQSLDWNEKDLDQEAEMEIREMLTLIYEDSNQPTKALDQFKQSTQIKDTLYQSQKTLAMNQLMLEHDVERKEKDLLLLEKENDLSALQLTQSKRNQKWAIMGLLFFLGLAGILFFQRQRLQRTKNKLQESNTEKETLLKEIHHRVKNNLQLITSLLNLQAADDEEQSIESFLSKGQNRVKSMALIHEQLYRSENVSSIDMGEYIKNLVQQIFSSHGLNNSSIKYNVSADPISLDIDKAIPIGLIINELVNNSLEHGFGNQNDGELHVEMKAMEENINLKIHDDGKGFDESQRQNSMGLQLVRLLIQQLKGKFELSGQQGTLANIQFDPST